MSFKAGFIGGWFLTGLLIGAVYGYAWIAAYDVWGHLLLDPYPKLTPLARWTFVLWRAACKAFELEFPPQAVLDQRRKRATREWIRRSQ